MVIEDCLESKEKIVDLQLKLLDVGYDNISSTKAANEMVFLLKAYYGVDFVTLFQQEKDGWFSIIATNAPQSKIRFKEKYYNEQRKKMKEDSLVMVQEGYNLNSYLSRNNLEYSNFTIINKNGRCLGALLLEHSNKDKLLSQSVEFDLYGKVFKTTTSVLNHLIEVSDLVKKVSTDQLTGVYNRRFIDLTLEEEVSKHFKLGQSFHIALLDIDHFKKFNDTYGHQFGDKVLQVISQYIKDNLGVHSWIARYGGEEFLIFIANSKIDRVYKKIEKLRQGVSELVIEYGGQTVNVTMSFGIAGFPIHGKTPEELISKADEALYMSKERGRNRVTIWGEN